MKEVKPIKSKNKSKVDLASIYRPVEGQMIIKNKVTSRTAAGIIIPEGQRAGDPFAEIVAIHPKNEDRFKAGDTVMLKPKESEIVPTDRLVIFKEYFEGYEIYYAQVSVGVAMGDVDPEFIELTKAAYKIEEAMREEESKMMANKPKIDLPPQGLVDPNGAPLRSV